MGLDANRVGGNVRELRPAARRRPLRRLACIAFVVALAAAAGHFAWGWYGERAVRREVARYEAAGDSLRTEGGDAGHATRRTLVDLIAIAERIWEDPRARWVMFDADSVSPLDEEQMVVVAGLLRRRDDLWARLDAVGGRAESPPADGGNGTGAASRGPDFWRLSSLEAFLQLAVRYHHQRGDDRRAFDCIRRLAWLARTVAEAPRGHDTAERIDRTTAHAVLQIARDLRVGARSAGGGDPTAESVTVGEAKAVIADLLDDSWRRASLMRAVHWQRAATYEYMREMTAGQRNLLGYPAYGSERAWLWLLRPMVLADTPIVLRQGDQATAAAGVAADLPAFVALAPDRAKPREARERPVLHFAAAAAAPNYHETVEPHFQVVTERRLAATALAIRCYAATGSGELPRTLDELVPQFLPAVPADPMAAGRRLTYRPDAVEPLLYGVGADGRDEGGNDQARDPGTSLGEEWDRLADSRDAVVHLKGPPPAAVP